MLCIVCRSRGRSRSLIHAATAVHADLALHLAELWSSNLAAAAADPLPLQLLYAIIYQSAVHAAGVPTVAAIILRRCDESQLGRVRWLDCRNKVTF